MLHSMPTAQTGSRMVVRHLPEIARQDYDRHCRSMARSPR